MKVHPACNNIATGIKPGDKNEDQKSNEGLSTFPLNKHSR